MARPACSPMTAFRYASALERGTDVPKTMAGTLALLDGPAGTPDPGMHKYRVVVGRSTGRSAPRVFGTSSFYGDGREVDLEDAFDLGGFDTVVVEKPRGTFGARESATILGHIVEDLTYEHLPWLFIDADGTRLVVRRLCDFDRAGARSYSRLNERILDALALCGFAPRVRRRQSHPRYLEVSVAMGDDRAIWALPARTSRWRHDLAKDFSVLEATTVVVRHFTGTEQHRASRQGKQLLSLWKLVSTLHAARIETLRRSLAAHTPRFRGALRGSTKHSQS